MWSSAAVSHPVCSQPWVCCQGLLLVPLLFSIFIIPVGHLITSFNISYHQYADDIQLYITINTHLSNGLANLSACADAIAGRYLENNLIRNPAKTEVLVSSTKQQIAKLDISVAQTTIPIIKMIRVLGVTLDHITNIVRTCNYRTVHFTTSVI